MIEIPDLAVIGLAAGTLSAFVLGGGLLRSRRQHVRQQAEITTLRSDLDSAREEVGRTSRAITAEVVHLAQRRLPAAATSSVHSHIQVPGPLRPDLLSGSALGAGLNQVLEGLLSAVTQERKRVDAAARAGMRGTTREIQAGLYRLQDVLRGLQQRYDEPELAETLFALDHENEQSLRRAQVAAVVCGAWVGLAREESHLVDAVTGGQSRLAGYHRIQIGNHLEDGTALVSHAVEPVAIIVAELLDNALRHSSPDTVVTVNLERAHHGVTVTVDDAGVGMAQDERGYAQRMVAGSDPILLSELGDPPRMGLAAIGQLTRQFDLTVDLSSPSPYGGVRAVLLINNHLLSHIDSTVRPPAAAAAHSTRRGSATTESAEVGPDPARPTLDAMPAQRNSETRSAAHPPATQPDRDSAQAPAPATERAPALGAPARPAGDGEEAPSHSAFAEPGTHEPVRSSAAHDGDRDDQVLPRRRRRTRPAPSADTPVRARPYAPVRTPEESAAALGALQAGTMAARNAEPVQEAAEPRRTVAELEGNDPR
ncbi:ATP-binding protein [Streptomyces albipurpureus]|uniref:histidine kinase n=1 Tax=Streptomyces albipurpureus TaxID=2897419 RepID=A0ABT0UY52_9ACTN|nr:ATP-binding protein [Streptomyces sp. CWNU-1]MCM2393347.1 ATP-binding protein [Streptomyces sp. CWNU-1]